MVEWVTAGPEVGVDTARRGKEAPRRERSPPVREGGERRSREPLLLYNCNFCLILSEINLEA